MRRMSALRFTSPKFGDGRAAQRQRAGRTIALDYRVVGGDLPYAQEVVFLLSTGVICTMRVLMT